MSLLRMLYLGLTVVGAVVPMFHFFKWFHQVDGGFWQMIVAWFANAAVTGLAWDIIISAVALTVWIVAEVSVRRNFEALLALPATFMIGVSCGLPLYLFLRTRPV